MNVCDVLIRDTVDFISNVVSKYAVIWFHAFRKNAPCPSHLLFWTVQCDVRRVHAQNRAIRFHYHLLNWNTQRQATAENKRRVLTLTISIEQTVFKAWTLRL